MPHIRCKFFFPDGKPRGEGCFNGDDCRYIHPNKPEWKTAGESSRGGGRRWEGKGRDYNQTSGWGSRGSSSYQQDRGYSHRPRAQTPPRPSEFDSSAWEGPPPDAPTTTPVLPAAGSSSWEDELNKASTMDDGNDSWGWPNQGWGNTTTGGWGAGGSTGSTWGEPSSSSSTQPVASASPSGRVSSSLGYSDASGGRPDANGKGKASSASGWGTAGSPKVVSPSFPSVTPADIPRSVKNDAAPSSSVGSHRTLPGRSIPAASSQSLDLQKSKERTTKPETSSAGKESPTHATASPRQGTPIDRTEIYKKMIRATLLTAKMKADVHAAKDKLNQWRHTRESKEFHTARPAARLRINEIRKTLGEEVSQLEKKAQNYLDNLVSLPDVSFRANDLDIDKVKADIVELKAELDTWTSELRSGIEKLEKGNEPDPVPEPHSASDIEMVPPTDGKWKPIESRAVTMMHDVRLRLEDLRKAKDRVEEELYPSFNGFFSIPDTVADHEARRREREESDPKKVALEGRLCALTTQINDMDVKLKNQTDMHGEAVANLAADIKRLVQLKLQSQDTQRLKASTKVLLDEYTEWEQERREKIRSLSAQVQLLHEFHRPPSMTAVTFTSPDVAEKVQAIVCKIVEDELLPMLHELRVEFTNALKRNNDLALQQINRKLQPALESTKKIYALAAQINPPPP